MAIFSVHQPDTVSILTFFFHACLTRFLTFPLWKRRETVRFAPSKGFPSLRAQAFAPPLPTTSFVAAS